MKTLFTSKYFVIALVALAVAVPLAMIDGLVAEREAYRDQVVADIARSSTSAQTLVGPLLVAPCTRTRVLVETDPKTGRERKVRRTSDCTQVFLPETLGVDAEVDTEQRRRGIYTALLYGSKLRFEARFSVPARAAADAGSGEIAREPAYIALGIADPRGIVNAPRLAVNGAERGFDAGAGLGMLGTGIRAALPRGERPFGQDFEVGFSLRLKGMGSLAFVPVGRQSSVAMRASWPHPSFSGRYLPESHEIGADGFTARWQTSVFATDMARLVEAHAHAKRRAPAVHANSFGVRFVNPVDLYTRADRAVKYGFLFVALTFAALVLTEVLQWLRIHPVQYAMVGVALAVFFLLLLSLAEHLGFGAAYALASAACVGLLWYYLRHVVPRAALSNGFAVGLVVLYALLYGLLSSEDYALLMGSVLVFAVLALVMVVTRDVDWYAFGGAGPAGASRRGMGEGAVEPGAGG